MQWRARRLGESDASPQFLFKRFIDPSNEECNVLLSRLFILQGCEGAGQGFVNDEVVADSTFEQALQRRHSITRPAAYFERDTKIETRRPDCGMRLDGFSKHRDCIFGFSA